MLLLISLLLKMLVVQVRRRVNPLFKSKVLTPHNQTKGEEKEKILVEKQDEIRLGRIETFNFILLLKSASLKLSNLMRSF